ncbi:hypothetical protein GOP47_0013217 [Adiantum capillus-veneris]|uniref:Uncharacterized protein n=1 Tax=Adiantum capillus-veneris TaxID=13818 RepID=A0A9D4UNT4_ADICA|nr:hypothetical protein GOP47_0013217 [Adiantum capillus-veneris]
MLDRCQELEELVGMAKMKPKEIPECCLLCMITKLESTEMHGHMCLTTTSFISCIPSTRRTFFSSKLTNRRVPSIEVEAAMAGCGRRGLEVLESLFEFPLATSLDDFLTLFSRMCCTAIDLLL